jgi:SPP1 family phage portal protein
MQGRRILVSDETEITENNILRVLRDVENSHIANRIDIEYLWNYYRGKQPILGRKKVVRPEINNKIVVNRAQEIVSFKISHVVGEPLQYVSRGADDKIADDIAILNKMMAIRSKPSLDHELIEWQHVAGTAFRMVLPVEEDDGDDVPFDIYTLDPRNTFVVYSNKIGNRPIMGVTYIEDINKNKTYSIYTKDQYFEIRGETVATPTPHTLGMIPIIEYPLNTARLGCFEVVLPLLDAINTTASNRLDSVEQTVQAFIKFINADISAEDFQALKDLGAIKVKSVDGQPADVGVVKVDLDQDQTQTLTDDLYSTVLTICAMPNRNGGSSTSDTGQAVQLRDGWSAAETDAKNRELMIRRSETQFLKLVLRILEDTSEINVKTKDIGIQFTRRIVEAIQSKAQVFVSMIQQEKCHPLLAFITSGLFTEPEMAWIMSRDWYEEQQAKQTLNQSKTTEKIEVVQE